MPIKIDTCTCHSVFQDAEYGFKKRVFNERIRGGKHVGWRCTICLRETVDAALEPKQEVKKPH